MDDTTQSTLVMTTPPTLEEALADPQRRAEWWAYQRARGPELIQLLRSWREENEEGAQEQRETWEYLCRVLDEDRLSDRKFYS